ncbi:MAG: hypothetical protein Q9227_006206 [Pyrenula ochraceoflavens]
MAAPRPNADSNKSNELQSDQVLESTTHVQREREDGDPLNKFDRPDPEPTTRQDTAITASGEEEKTQSKENASENINEALLNAAENGNDAQVKLLMDQGAQIEATSFWDETALSLAAQSGHASVVKILLDMGATPRIRDSFGGEPLLWASLSGNSETVRLLLHYGADIETKATDGETALIMASRRGHCSVVKLLLEKKADIRAKEDDGTTALHSASFNGHDSIVKMLIENEADIRARDNNGNEPLHRASIQPCPNTVRILLENGAAIDAQNSLGERPLGCAALGQDHGNTETVQTLLEKGAEVNFLDNEGIPPLQYAAQKGSRHIVELLLEHGADISIAQPDGWTALHMAAHNANEGEEEPITGILLDYGADVHAIDDRSQTPLHFACKLGRTRMAKLLLKHEAQADARDKNGWTALHLASSHGHGNVVQLLVEKGADVEIETADTKQSALVLAIVSSREDEGMAERREDHTSAVECLAQKTSLFGKKLAIDQVTAQEDLEVLTHAKCTRNEEKSEIQEMKLLWFAKRPAHHSTVGEILRENPIKTPEEPNSPLEWAAYHGKHDVAWWILKTSLLTEKMDKERERARRIAESRKGKFKSSKRSKNPAKGDKLSQKSTTAISSPKVKDKRNYQPFTQIEERRGSMIQDESRVEEDEENRFSLTLDMLRDPPLVVGMSDSDEAYQTPVIEDTVKRDIDKFEATIVDFYRRDGRVNFLRRSRKVFNVIYDKNAGVEKIMKEARGTLKKISPEAAKEKDEPLIKKEKSRFASDNVSNALLELAPAAREEDAEAKTNDHHVAIVKAEDGENIKDSEESDNGKISKEKKISEGDKKAENGKEAEEDKEIDDSKKTEDGKDTDDDKEKKRNESVAKSREKVMQAGRQGDVEGKQYPDILGTRDSTPTSSVSPNGKSTVVDIDHGKIRADRRKFVLICKMPYITFGKHYPDHAQVLCKETYKQLIDAYNGKIIHKSRSLDQFYYQTLENMSERDADQVATRYITGKRETEVQKLSDWTILRVDQLWLWVIDEETIVTCSTHRPDEMEDPVIEKIFNYLRLERGKGKGQPAPSSVDEMSKFIVNFCIGFINQATWDTENKNRSPLQAINEANLFKCFTNKVKRKREESEGTQQMPQDKQKGNVVDTGAKPPSSDLSNKALETEDGKAISNAADLLEEVKDIRDELNILKTLLAQQNAVWEGLFSPSPDTREEKNLVDAINAINEMLEMSATIQQSVNDILGLEQNGINVTESVLSRELAERSREQAEESFKQGKTLMVFTIVTIIFVSAIPYLEAVLPILPLSFLASLFALNISVFQHDRHGNLAYRPGWIFPKIICVSAGISVLLIVVALNVERMTRMLNRLFKKGGKDSLPNGKDPLYNGKDSFSDGKDPSSNGKDPPSSEKDSLFNVKDPFPGGKNTPSGEGGKNKLNCLKFTILKRRQTSKATPHQDLESADHEPEGNAPGVGSNGKTAADPNAPKVRFDTR